MRYEDKLGTDMWPNYLKLYLFIYWCSKHNLAILYSIALYTQIHILVKQKKKNWPLFEE